MNTSVNSSFDVHFTMKSQTLSSKWAVQIFIGAKISQSKKVFSPKDARAEQKHRPEKRKEMFKNLSQHNNKGKQMTQQRTVTFSS